MQRVYPRGGITKGDRVVFFCISQEQQPDVLCASASLLGALTWAEKAGINRGRRSTAAYRDVSRAPFPGGGLEPSACVSACLSVCPSWGGLMTLLKTAGRRKLLEAVCMYVRTLFCCSLHVLQRAVEQVGPLYPYFSTCQALVAPNIFFTALDFTLGTVYTE